MTRRTRPALQALEGRLTPAGNLTTQLVAGSLFVTGDDQANLVAVTQSAPNAFTLTPESGTTINGQADPVTIGRVTQDLVFRLGGGDDRVRLGAGFGPDPQPRNPVVVARDLVIDGGPGNNAIDNPLAAVTTGRHFRIANGAGGSRAEFRGQVTVGGDFTAVNGNGFNAVVFSPDQSGFGFVGSDSVRGNLTIRNGVGGAENTLTDVSVGGNVLVENGPAGDFNVATGLGAGLGPAKAWVGGNVTVRNAGGFAVNALGDIDVRGSVLFQSGPGDSVNNVQARDRGDTTIGRNLTVRAGAGATRVDLGADVSSAFGLTVGGNLAVATGAGDDSVSLAVARVHGAAAVDTGADNDRVDIDDTVFGGRLSLATGLGTDAVVFEGRRPDSFRPQNFAGPTDLWQPSAITLGAGDDTLRLGAFEDPARAVRLFALLRADGGAGSDFLDAANVTPVDRLRAVSFERLAPPPVFHRPTTYPVGEYVQDVEAVDLDGDGDLDLVSANADSDTVSVLLNNGDGTFGFALSFDAGESPFGLAVGDFNRDGRPDLAAANSTQSPNGTVSVLLGNGDGTFGDPTAFPVGDQADPVDVEAADFNGDGKLELVTGNRADNNMASASILLGNGDGTFGAATQYRLSDDPNTLQTGWAQDVAVGDLNGDGKPDVVLSALRAIGSFLNTGDGTLALKFAEARGLSTEIALGDLNGDGKLDLVQATAGVVQFGIGDGTFGAAVTWFDGGVSRVAVGDFNNDGKLDIVATTFDADGAIVFGIGDGTFREPQRFDVGPDGGPLAAADLNGDGWLDLAVGNENEASVSVLLNTQRAI